jgi:hypothetical protein
VSEAETGGTIGVTVRKEEKMELGDREKARTRGLGTMLCTMSEEEDRENIYGPRLWARRTCQIGLFGC